ncbi:hypothetical protein DFQ14_10498 [Halopolyspora algeriensis]|uniref:Uncharacterized protein n=1 Tax=Halopolyspora algeriensis TaxID=1500506 RepID=A0A368VS28_9ACTN|nr:hypothetical protein [Halopolyspora algeriensis]RCW44509.1 hypothetical protein DFQ14_10498 [Halopolyspora algeriensis]TQM55869.1 hypothetical protein FHU43_0647 [Halopolyspora algeriensis]
MGRTMRMTHTDRATGTVSLSLPVTVLLAALAVPRVVVHDLGLAGPGPLNTLLVFLPPIVWLVVVLRARVTNPFFALLVVGLVYGLFLAAGHQLFWHETFGDDPPALGGNLAGALPAGLEVFVLRAFAVLSSIATGALVGAITGAFGWALSKGLHAPRNRKRRSR